MLQTLNVSEVALHVLHFSLSVKHSNIVMAFLGLWRLLKWSQSNVIMGDLLTLHLTVKARVLLHQSHTVTHCERQRCHGCFSIKTSSAH